MTNSKAFPAELAEETKDGVKSSDLKKSKSTPTSCSSFNLEKYASELETEKAELLTKIAAYEREQKASVVIFHDQEKLIDEKGKQLDDREQLISEKEEAIAKLKTRI